MCNRILNFWNITRYVLIFIYFSKFCLYWMKSLIFWMEFRVEVFVLKSWIFETWCPWHSHKYPILDIIDDHDFRLRYIHHHKKFTTSLPIYPTTKINLLQHRLQDYFCNNIIGCCLTSWPKNAKDTQFLIDEDL